MQLLDGSAKLVAHYNPSQKLRLVIGLQRPNVAAEEKFLKELHTKGSPNFMKFLTAAEWNARFSPSAADEQAVVDWATSQGFTVTHRYANRLLVDVEAPAAAIETAFGVTINSYQVGTRTAFSNDRDPAIPAPLQGKILSVGGLNSIQVLRPASGKVAEPAFSDYVEGPAIAAAGKGAANAKSKRPAKASGLISNISGGAYDPTDIYSSQAYDVQALYNQGHCCNPLGNSGVTPPESSIAIATAGTQNGSDFAGFQSAYPYLAYHYQQYYIDGTPGCCDGEGTLDFDWSTAWSNSFGSYVDTAMIYLYDGVNANFSTFTDVYNQILSDGHARVFSTSWGCEEIYCTPTSVMATDHGIFNSMVGQGWTLVAASGDQGASAGCTARTAVQYPASDPNVVGAGGTNLDIYPGYYLYEYGWSGGPDGCASNDGGSTGGPSAYFSGRTVPDIALNADWYYSPQNFYFGGALSGNGGTSIVAPSVAGFFAQANAYLDYVQTINGGCYSNPQCAPIGNGNNYLNYFGGNPTYPSHYPFYDILYGCNNNDYTAYYGLTYYCAGTGRDEVTGWGSFNALQLAWAIVTYRAGDFVPPTATFYSSGATNTWYNTDQYVEWTVADAGESGLPATGVAGFTQTWDSYIYDYTSEATPGSGNGFYSGPEYPNSTFGYQYVSWAGQGCHYTYVRSYDNSGWNQLQYFGPTCYDTVPPATTAALHGTITDSVYSTPVKVTLSASDASSGVSHTYYSVNGAAYKSYTAPFNVAALGYDSVYYYSTDNAGNAESVKNVAFTSESTTTTSVFSSLNPATYGQNITFTAAVAAARGATPAGSVQFFHDGVALGTRPLSAGQAKFSIATMSGGVHGITAVYLGNAKDLTSTSGALTQTVNKATTTTTEVSSLNPSTFGTTVTFTATVTPQYGGAVGGKVQFKDGTTVLGTVAISGGKAAYATAALARGSHKITAHYMGNASLDTSASAAITQTVN